MKSFLIGLLVAAIAGVAVGYTTASRQYVWPTERFGHFSKGGDLTPEELPAYVAGLQQKGRPQAEIQGEGEYDFGEMLRFTEGKHRFVLKNVGDADLELSVRSTSCKCTIGKLGEKSLKPGESTEVEMVWSVKTYANRFEQTATIGTTDPQNAELQLRIYGDVIDRLMLEPAVWAIGDTTAGGPIELEATVLNRCGFDVEFVESSWLEKMQGVEPQLGVEPIEVPEALGGEDATVGQAFRVQLKIPPGLNQGPLLYTAQLQFQPVEPAAVPEDEVEDLTVPIRLEGRIVGDIVVIGGGSQLTGRPGGGFIYTFSQVEFGKGAEAKLKVLLRGDHFDEANLKIDDVTPENVLAAELGEPKTGGGVTVYPLTLRIREDAPPDEKIGNNSQDYGMVWVKSDHEEVAPLRLRVRYQVRHPDL